MKNGITISNTPVQYYKYRNKNLVKQRNYNSDLNLEREFINVEVENLQDVIEKLKKKYSDIKIKNAMLENDLEVKTSRLSKISSDSIKYKCFAEVLENIPHENLLILQLKW